MAEVVILVLVAVAAGAAKRPWVARLWDAHRPRPLTDFEPASLRAIASFLPSFAQRLATGAPLSLRQLQRAATAANAEARRQALARGYDLVRYASYVMRIQSKDGTLDEVHEDESPEKLKARFASRYHPSNLAVTPIRPGKARPA